MGIGRFAFTPILPMMQVDEGLTVAAGGWLASVNYVGYLFGALSAVAIRIRPTMAIRAGLVVIGLATLGMGLEHRFWGWVVLRGLAGVASAWVLISVSVWALARLTPLRRPLLNSTVFAGVGAGIAAAGALTVLLMYARGSSAQAWIGLGVLTFAATVSIWPVLSGDGEASSRDTRHAASSHYRWNSESIRLVLCYGTFGFGYIIPATFLPVMARQAVQDPWIFGWAWPVFGLAAAASTILGSLVLENRRKSPPLDRKPARHGPRRVPPRLPVRPWRGHARRPLRRRHVHGEHHGRDAGSARGGWSRCDPAHGGNDGGLRPGADRWPHPRELRGGDRSRVLEATPHRWRRPPPRCVRSPGVTWTSTNTQRSSLEHRIPESSV
jgi:Uncharacterised MFS-type transporter YbfB